MLAQLRRVDEAGFARTLPAEMVTPDESAAEVEQILADVPLPPGLTPAEVRVEGYQQRYHVIAAATDAALCGWVDVLVAADRDGVSRAAQREARAALETVRDWDALPETLDEGDWAPVMYQAGDDAQAGLPGLTLAERYCSG